jgi:O-antigen/teichoic acid export membrane protein
LSAIVGGSATRSSGGSGNRGDRVSGVNSDEVVPRGARSTATARPGCASSTQPENADAPDTRTRRGLIWHSLWTLGSNVVLPLTSLLTGPILARVLGPDGRGLMAAVLAPIFIAKAVASTALPSAATYAVAKLRHPPRAVGVRAAALALAYGTVAAAVLWLLAPVLLAQSPEGVGLLRTATLALPILMVALALQGVAIGERRYDLANAERVVAAVGRLVVLAALAVAGALTIGTAVWTNVSTTAAAALILLPAVVRATAPSPPIDTGRSLTRELAVYGALGWGGILATLVNYRFDQAILAMFVDASQIGYYAVAVSLTQLPATLASTRTVFFAEASHRRDLALVARATAAMIGVSLVVLIIGVPLAGPAIELLFGADFRPAVPLARVLLVGGVPYVAEQILAVGLLSAGRPGRQSLGQATAAVLTIVGLVILLPRMGVMGAAVTSVVAYSTSFLVSAALFRRESGIPLREIMLPRVGDARWLVGRARAIVRRRR